MLHQPSPASLAEFHVDRLLTRNAELIVALRHTAHAVHQSRPEHGTSPNWMQCAHPVCRRIQALLGESR